MKRRSSASLRTRLTRTLVALGFVSVVLLSTVNFIAVRFLLDESVSGQLEAVADLRKDRIERGIDRVLDRIASVATDPGVGDALADLADGYARTDTPLTVEQLTSLESVYDDVVRPYDEVDAPRPPIADLLPDSEAGRAVQYQYIAANPDPARPELLVDAGDGSPYTEAHARHHQFLSAVAATAGVDDLLLVGAGTNDVVYSVGKRVDLGTDAESGPYGESGLGRVVQRVALAAVFDAVIVDISFYLPDASAPLVHVAATVRRDAEVIGAVVVTLRTERLTEVISANGEWELLGLGETGDAYLVGSDGILRSIPRAWTDDPDAYIERYLDTGGEARGAELMAFTGAPILLHQIDNAAVSTARGGEPFIGVVDNGLNRRSLTAAEPLDLPGLDWMIVTEQRTSETRNELMSFLWTTLIVLAVLLPVLALVGNLLARVFARPVDPLVAAARDIADGDYDTTVDDLGRNELGDLGRQLELIATRLREQNAAIDADEERIVAMLASVLPADLVDRVRRGERDVAEAADSATVITLVVNGLPEPSGIEQDAVFELTELLVAESEALCRTHGVERIRAASDHLLFVAGRERDGLAIDPAVDFAIDAVARVAAIGTEHGVPLTARAGLASGLVASGVVGTRQLSFGLWGEPVDRAEAISEFGEQPGVYVDADIAELLRDHMPLERVDHDAREAADFFAVPSSEESASDDALGS